MVRPLGAGRTYPTPSAAITHGACALCLGRGITTKVTARGTDDEGSPCWGCGGSGLLDDMLARQCDDPNCVEHHHRRDAELNRLD